MSGKPSTINALCYILDAMKQRLPRGRSSESGSIELVAQSLEGYASRGVFRGFSRGPATKVKAAFKMLWHRDRFFELFLDLGKKTMHFPVVLPEVPPKSSMYLAYQEFVASRHSKELPAHRRIDTSKASVRCSNRGGNVGLTLTVVDGDFEYGARKLINLVHETFLVSLTDGPYYEYMVEVFDLDPDKP